jgi:hypothetical protein
MTRVWIAQCLCGPERHCILATADEAADETEAATRIAGMLRAQVAEWLAAESLNPWCGICGAKAEGWVYEIGRTRFETMRDALPEMLEIKRRQAATRALIGDRQQGKPH